jgi:hypothetical protein
MAMEAEMVTRASATMRQDNGQGEYLSWLVDNLWWRRRRGARSKDAEQKFLMIDPSACLIHSRRSTTAREALHCHPCPGAARYWRPSPPLGTPSATKGQTQTSSVRTHGPVSPFNHRSPRSIVGVAALLTMGLPR